MSKVHPLLTAESISKRFAVRGQAPLEVLQDISFSVRPGQIVGILGASGCGKTTLLSVLAGMTGADSGRVLSSISRPGRDIGFVQQGERLLPWRTAAANVALGLELHGVPRSEAASAAREALRRVGLNDAAGRYPHELSGGMTQRALLARALVANPKLLLLDEPLGQLDLSGRMILQTAIRDYVSGSGAGAALVTHSVEEAVFLCDSVLVLAGRPATIVKRFAIDTDETDATRLERTHSFEPVLRALLETLPPTAGATSRGSASQAGSTHHAEARRQ